MALPVGDIVGVMQDLGFEGAVIASVVTAIEDSCQVVDRARDLDAIDPTSFGDVDEGYELARDTELAREKVREAMTDMITGLGSYRDALVGLVADSAVIEDNTVTSLQRIEQGQACVVTPSFAAPSQCAPAPTGSEG